MVAYFILQKRSEGTFGQLSVAKSLPEAKKTKDYYHNTYKIPMSQIYIAKMMEY